MAKGADMKISEFIDELQKFKEIYGDLNLVVLGLPGESKENLVPIYSMVPATDEESEEAVDLVICGEGLYDELYETHEHLSPRQG